MFINKNFSNFELYLKRIYFNLLIQRELNTKEEISQFYDEVQNKLSSVGFEPNKQEALWSIPITNRQCLYIVNFIDRAVIYHKGVKELLGYDEDEITIDLVLDYVHPDDKDVVMRVVKGVIEYATSNKLTLSETCLSVSYRVRKKNGEYLKVMRQTSLLDGNDEGMMVSCFSILSDISYMETSNRVEWVFEGPEIDREEFKKYIYDSYKGFFSKRETEILKFLREGYTSRQLSEKLFISKDTVDTHRKNMLRKSGCGNTRELVNYALNNGVI